VQKKYAPSLPISGFHAYVGGGPLAGAPPSFSGAREPWLREVLLDRRAIPQSAAGQNRLNHRGAIKSLDRDAALV
jgi:hypothetical protein